METKPTDEQILEKTTRGWLQPYLVTIDQMFSRRWDYWFRTVEAGEILDESIPQINWLSQGHPKSRKNLETCINQCRDRFTEEAFDLFVEWMLFGFGDNSVQEFPAQIPPSLNAFWYKTFNLGLFLQHPYDLPGRICRRTLREWGTQPNCLFPDTDERLGDDGKDDLDRMQQNILCLRPLSRFRPVIDGSQQLLSEPLRDGH